MGRLRQSHPHQSILRMEEQAKTNHVIVVPKVDGISYLLHCIYFARNRFICMYCSRPVSAQRWQGGAILTKSLARPAPRNPLTDTSLLVVPIFLLHMREPREEMQAKVGASVAGVAFIQG
jgi:hypothetical protein